MALSDAQVFTAITATTDAFQLWGGRYSFTGTSNGGDWELQRLSPDGTSWTNSIATVNGATTSYTSLDLGPGMYRINLDGSSDTGAYFELARF